MEASGSTYRITVTSRRKRLIDIDNACLKFAIDALRHAGVIPDDDPGTVSEVVFRQEKHKGQPETVIRIERLD